MAPGRIGVELNETKIDEIFSELEQWHAPGAAVGIAIDGSAVYRKGFGLANADLPIVLSPTVRMRIASVSKHFTCLAYMLFCEDGKASIDDPIGTHLPELHPVTHQVTARQLMGNISGLRDACDISWQFGDAGSPITSADMLSLYRDMDDRQAAPGTAWIYNNGGFLILSAMIERLAGKPLEHVLRERIFEPLHLYDTMLSRWDTGFTPHSATPHVSRAEGGFEKSRMGLEMAGHGGIVSTVDDMLRWLAHMDAPTIGSPDTWTAMKAAQTLVNGTSTGYGLGLAISRYRGVETIAHAGGWVGANAQMTKVPAAGLDIVVLANRSDVSSTILVNRILDACLSGLRPVEEAPKAAPITGIFRSSTTDRVIELAVEQGQQIASIDGYAVPVVPDDHGTLHPAGVMSFVKQALTPIGSMQRSDAISLSDFGSRDELLRQASSASVDAGTLVGRYRSDSTGIEATISATDNRLGLTTQWRLGSAVYELEYLADRIWRCRSRSPRFFGSVLSFDASCAEFRFWTCRTRALLFRRCI